MLDNKNLIEILNIEGNEVAVSRQGINNCMVNLTQMAKPYGKLVADWLRLKSTREYLTHRGKAAIEEKRLLDRYGNSHNENQERCEDSPITFDPTYGGQIIMVQGGNAKEQGTWCTDFHIALDFALWLDPVRKDIVYDHFIKFLTGRNVGTLVNTRILPAPKHREGFRKLEAILRRYTSLANLKEIAKRHNVTLHHVKDVLSGNSVSNPVLQSIIDTAKENKNKGITFPDWRIRKKGIDYGQTAFDFEPQEIVELKEQED